MCLYVDDEGDWEPLDNGERRARKEHRCMECGRVIEPGETYRYWTGVWEGDVVTNKMCAHCQAVIDLGHAITGCPKVWNVGVLYDRDPELGFVANCLHDEGHDLRDGDRALLLACYEGAKRRWRHDNGMLMSRLTLPA